MNCYMRPTYDAPPYDLIGLFDEKGLLLGNYFSAEDANLDYFFVLDRAQATDEEREAAARDEPLKMYRASVSWIILSTETLEATVFFTDSLNAAVNFIIERMHHADEFPEHLSRGGNAVHIYRPDALRYEFWFGVIPPASAEGGNIASPTDNLGNPPKRTRFLRNIKPPGVIE